MVIRPQFSIATGSKLGIAIISEQRKMCLIEYYIVKHSTNDSSINYDLFFI